ncbi:MAG: hypothetical protein AUK47_17560 [Deltaproteobacteria bacterium CG2_30_63_29]|nr:MAG: hypothetical protein AUK47_17560 [Deltaproteobacteria bacterium CG2_30_63_29]
MNIMTTKPKPFGVLLRAGWRRAWGPLRPQLIALQLMLMVPLVSMTACEDDVVKQAPPRQQGCPAKRKQEFKVEERGRRFRTEKCPRRRAGRNLMGSTTELGTASVRGT